MKAHLNDDPTMKLDPDSERWKILEALGMDIATCDPPCVFGIHGDWGAGKTSFLWRIYHELSGRFPPGVPEESRKLFDDKRKSDEVGGRKEIPGVETLGQHRWKIEPIWFDAWRYQGEPVPVAALLQEIRRQIVPRLDHVGKVRKDLKELIGKGRELIGETIGSISWKIKGEAPKLAQTFLPSLGVELGGTIPRWRNAANAFEAQHFAADLTTDKLREELNNAIQLLITSDATRGRRLVIFIDDLDRCGAEAAFRLLEGIKVYLNLPSCVFVLGLNQREIERAIAVFLPPSPHEAGDEDALLIRAQEYIEKLCNSIVRLPRLPLSDQEAILTELLEGAKPPKLVASLIQLHKDYSFLPANPRRVKAWCGVVLRLLALRENRLKPFRTADGGLPVLRTGDVPFAVEDQLEARALAFVASLYQFHPQIYALLESQPIFIEMLTEWAKSPPEKEIDGSWNFRIHAVARRYRFPERTYGKGALVSAFEDAMSIGVLHCAALLSRRDFANHPLRAGDIQLYLPR